MYYFLTLFFFLQPVTDEKEAPAQGSREVKRRVEVRGGRFLWKKAVGDQ